MVSAFFWKLMERIGVQGIQFVLQLILARLLEPEHYGILSIMIFFKTLANAFIQTGFNTALIQNKDVTEDDYSSVFWASLAIAVLMYGLIYVGAPAVGAFYDIPDIVWPLRALSLVLFPGALYSIQLAKITRELDFKKMFYSSIGGILAAGIAGIIIAYMGGGLWALVAQTLLNVTAACIVMTSVANWRPRFVFSLKRVIMLLRFGWKVLVSNLLEIIYGNLSTLMMGTKYDSGTLGYFNRGIHFPQFITNAITDTIRSVMLPALSAKQDNKATVKEMTRVSMAMSAYIIFPMMAGLAAVSTPLVTLLLTEKWLPCVPYLRVYCFTMALFPIHSCNLQAINAIGRSDVFLKVEVIKRAYGIVLLVIAVFCFETPMAVALTVLLTTVISWFVNAIPNKKLIGYSCKEQLWDMLPATVLSLVMCGAVLVIGHWCETMRLATVLVLVIQVVAGAVIYLALSVMFKLKSFTLLLETAKKYLKK